MTETPRLLLVGSNQQENLALQYLAAAAEGAGWSPRLVGFNDRRDLAQVLAAVDAEAPELVGLNMAFQYLLDDHLELASLLRARGFAGHLTAGGHVPTFCWRELMESCSAFDTLVRHEGEETLVEMLGRLQRGQPVAGTPGCVWREGSRIVSGPVRPVCVDLDSLPTPWRPERPYRVAGMPIAFGLGARGCIGECAYCSIRAFSSSAGGPSYRLRSPESLAREIAALARRGVRVVFLQDDLFVLPDERRAVARMEAIHRALIAEGVPRMGFWVKGRPESITPRVVEAARRMGAIHLFLGIESAVKERLEYLGRTHGPEHDRRAIDLCLQHGVGVSFNLMLFDPDSPLEHVAETVRFAREYADIPWNVCRTEIYPGTRLFERLRDAGRLRGDFHGWGYSMLDPRAELGFRILRVCLHERALAAESLHNRLISLAFGMQAQQWWFPGPATNELAARALALGRETRRDTADMLERVLTFAGNADPGDAVGGEELAIREGLAAGRRDAARYAEASSLWERLHARGRVLVERLTEAAVGSAPVPTCDSGEFIRPPGGVSA